jgi:hypothetical protein
MDFAEPTRYPPLATRDAAVISHIQYLFDFPGPTA